MKPDTYIPVPQPTIQMLFRHPTHELLDELSYRLKTGTRSVAYKDFSSKELWKYIKDLREDTILRCDTSN